jgi:replicative DNA helicase
MAKDLDVPVILLAQLSRKPEDRENKRPLMSDLRDSGAIEQDADAVGFIYRDEQYNPDSPHKGYAEVIWRKVRQGEPGTDWFVFQGALQKFLPAVRPEPIAPPVRKKPYQVAVGAHWSD